MRYRLLAALAVAAATTQAGLGQKKPRKPPAPQPLAPPADPALSIPPAPGAVPLAPPTIPPPAAPTAVNAIPSPTDPTPAGESPETVDTILRRLAAVRADRDALTKEEAALKGRLRLRLQEQGELMRALGVDPGTAQATTAAGSPALYFPTVVGTERVYLVGGREVRDVVTAVERDGDAFVVTLAKPDQPGGDVRVLSVSGDKVLIHRNGDLRYDPPHVVLRPKAKVGDSWHLFGTPGEGEVHRLAGAERVTVPGGTFDALRVDYGARTAGGFEAAGSLWYTPGVGSVKNNRGGKDVLLLKSFKPGGGAAPAPRTD